MPRSGTRPPKKSNDKIVTYNLFPTSKGSISVLPPRYLAQGWVRRVFQSSFELNPKSQTKSPMSVRKRDLSGFRLLHRSVNSRSSTLFRVILTLSLLFQFSAGAEDIASFGHNSVALLTTQDGKTPIAQNEN